jgi:dihydrofolate reductase
LDIAPKIKNMKAIAAMSCNRVIGIDGNLPWKNKRDLRFFKTITLGSKLVMGRKTFESTGLLPHRTFHVVTNNTDHKNIIDASTGRDIVTYGKIESVDIDGKNNSWLCGGAEMYKKLLPVCTDLYLTIMLDDFDGDTEMPEFEGISTTTKDHQRV